MHRDTISAGLRAGIAILAALGALRGAAAAECPAAGAAVEVALRSATGVPAGTAAVFGVMTAAACDDPTGRLATTYAHNLACDGETDDCAVRVAGLRPGEWTHRILATGGRAAGQFQARRDLLLDASAGIHRRDWPLYDAVFTVTTLDDAADCTGCLRAAIAGANQAPGPSLIQFARELAGAIRLHAALPPLAADRITLDGTDAEGVTRRRTIDGNGLRAAGVRVTAAHCHVVGLRVINVGGDADAVLVDGPGAFENVLDELEVVGRSLQVCGTNGAGCVVDGTCLEPSLENPRGACGDDAIAVRSMGGGGANRIRRCSISGARDKGVKVSEGGVAVVEDSLVFGNADGGLQATLSGDLAAYRNVIVANRGTSSANGLAANGAAIGSSVPSRLVTRGNLSVGNTLRGISVRSLSEATLRDDFLCGNALGLSLLDAAGTSPTASASGLAVVRNTGAGVTVADTSRLTFGDAGAPGWNAVAFNGPPAPRTPANFRNGTPLPLAAVGNAWEHCGRLVPCDVAAVQALDIAIDSPLAPVAVDPALPTRRRAAPTITAIEPPVAMAGELVRIYGEGFDALEGIGRSCAAVATANSCRPLHGNCVLVDRVPAEVVAVTPTMLVIRAPFTCVAPVRASVRTRWGHGFAHAPFCVLPPASAAE